MIPQDKLVDLNSSNHEWDVIIIGGGMGGSNAAYQLATQGHKVLLIEKGKATFESAAGVEVEQEDPKERLENGKWPQKLSAEVDGNLSDIWAPLGCGVGGSTLLYAAALQRLLPLDFDEQTTPDGRKISWPFSYSEIEPFYQQAESLFSVCGTRDPLDKKSNYDLIPPPAMCDRDQHYFQVFKEAGFNPHRLHVAFKYKKDCGECGGHICQFACKQDGKNAAILPALASGNLYIAEETEVLKIHADSTRITSIAVNQNGKTCEVSAKIIALAAGAYFTPVLLLKSENEHWPNGLANKSGLVGKNLMFHASDFIAFWPKQKFSRQGPNKTIALRDLYHLKGEKMGEFQSTGLAAGYGIVMYALRLLFDQSPFRKLTPLRHFLRIPAYIASKLYGEATVFTTIVEDYPYEDNCVHVDETRASGMRFEYHIKDEFRSRVTKMKKLIRQRLSSLRSIPMGIGVSLNYGHPCGTTKAGHDPLTSVVDKDCKAHGIENLYVVDSSFMPTSGGTNPSLTIAANALRVSSTISEKLKS